MSSATSPGGVPAPAGNTLYGEVPRSAPDPADVKPYRSERYVPPTQVTVLPRPLDACYRTSPEDYPEAARRLGIEARVPLVLTVDETGAIVDARVVKDPGHGLGAAAVDSLKRHGCRFAPARRGDEAVLTSFGFTVRFELP
jgi:protein TonB